MKKLMILICSLSILTLSSVVAFGEVNNNCETPPPGYGNEYSTSEVPFVFGERANEMDKSEQERLGIVDPFADSPYTRASVEKLCFIDGTSNWDIYSTATGSTKIGFAGPRERVYVYNNDDNSNRYYIRFLNYGVEDYGYISKNAVKIPSYGWAAPITTGNITQDFNAGTHAGIDVGVATGTRINAVTKTQHKSRIYTGVVSGITYLVNYGNYIETTTDGVQVIYAHLSDFSQGTPSTLPSYRNSYSGAESISTSATWTPNRGTKIGESGNSGWSNGAHLHFEVRKSGNISTKYDPYQYVVFPDIGY